MKSTASTPLMQALPVSHRITPELTASPKIRRDQFSSVACSWHLCNISFIALSVWRWRPPFCNRPEVPSIARLAILPCRMRHAIGVPSLRTVNSENTVVTFIGFSWDVNYSWRPQFVPSRRALWCFSLPVTKLSSFSSCVKHGFCFRGADESNGFSVV